MCDEAGVKLEMTAPYMPDTNPIEEYFAEIKAYVKLQWDEHINLIQRDFGSYVKSCVQTVVQRQASAKGHVRNAGLAVE
jgi:transposase